MPYNYRVLCPTCQEPLHPSGIIKHALDQHKLTIAPEQRKTFRAKCNICDAILAGIEMASHLKTVHSLPQFSTLKVSKLTVDASPLDVIRAAEKQIQSGILSLEGERDRLHERIVEIDNLVARYKKFNGHS